MAVPSIAVNPIPTGIFVNFVRLGWVENARTLCLLISQQLLALELSFKFVEKENYILF